MFGYVFGQLLAPRISLQASLTTLKEAAAGAVSLELAVNGRDYQGLYSHSFLVRHYVAARPIDEMVYPGILVWCRKRP